MGCKLRHLLIWSSAFHERCIRFWSRKFGDLVSVFGSLLYRLFLSSLCRAAEYIVLLEAATAFEERYCKVKGVLCLQERINTIKGDIHQSKILRPEVPLLKVVCFKLESTFYLPYLPVVLIFWLLILSIQLLKTLTRGLKHNPLTAPCGTETHWHQLGIVLFSDQRITIGLKAVRKKGKNSIHWLTCETLLSYVLQLPRKSHRYTHYGS